MKKYGVMVIGCGHIGQRHIESIFDKDNVNIVCVIDSVIETAKSTAEKYGIEKYGTDYMQFIKDENIDIVIIATYPSTHIEILKHCLENGKHVLCEKPIGTKFEDKDEFKKLVSSTDKKVLVSLVLRHDAKFLKMKELIDSGVIGEIRSIRMIQNQQIHDSTRFFNLLKDCTPMLDCGMHYVDVASWFTNSKIKYMTCFGSKINKNAARSEHTMLNFRTESGCFGYFEIGWSKNISSQKLVEFIGEKGRMELVYGEDDKVIKVYGPENENVKEYSADLPDKAFALQFEDLIKYIENDETTNPTVDEVIDAFTVVEKAQEISEQNIVLEL